MQYCGFAVVASHVTDKVVIQVRTPYLGGRRIVGGAGFAIRGRLAAIAVGLLLTVFSGTSNADSPRFEIDIRSSNAAVALNELAKQTGAIMLFPYDIAESRQANSVVGLYTLEEALEKLLEGSGLEGSLSHKRVVQISIETSVERTDEERAPMKKGKRAGIAFVLASLLSATGTSAQDLDEEAALEEIVVTGTRLTNRAFSGIAPVQVIDPEVAKLSGAFSAADIVRSSSLATGSFQLNQQLGATSPGGTVGGGGGGINAISLRGLGTQRSLVVLDGHRLAPAGVRGQVGAVDLNVLPSSALQRIEIVKDGSSSVYGADAIAGVVNGITKKNYDGGSIEANGNIPTEGGGERYFVSGDFGKTFDKGWFSIAAEYSEEQSLKNRERDFLSCAEDVVYFPDTGERADVIMDDGSFMCRSHNPNGAFFSADWFSGTFQPDPSGAFIGAPGDEFTRPDLPDWVRVGNFWLDDTEEVRASYALRNEDSVAYQNADAISPLKRLTLFLNGKLDIGERTSLYGNVLLNRRESEFNSWMFLFQPMSGNHPNNVVSAGLQAASGGQSTGAIQYQLVRPFNSTQEIDYYNGLVGLTGEFPQGFLSGWSWDASVSFGRSDGEYSQNFLYEDRLNAISLGTTPCDPSFLIPSLSPASLCDGIDIPVLGTRFLVDQDWTPQELAFLEAREAGRTTYDQMVTEASIMGDLFDLPAGPVETVIGLSYRKDEIDDRPGPNTVASNLHLFSSAGRTAGSESVREVFGEIGVPIVTGKPFAENVSAVGSIRYTDYDISGEEVTYKAGFNWGFSESVALRGSYGTSFRGPNLFELFLADQTSFNFLSDPCLEYANSTNPTVVSNCSSLGIPDDYRPLVFDTEVSTGGAVLPDGSTTIEPETSESWSVGLLLMPGDFGLAIAIEYFEIEVKDEIDSLGAQQILNACYSDVNFPDSSFCSLIERNGASGPDPFLLTLISDRFLNIDSQTNRGIDLLLRYQRDFSGFELATAIQGTYQIEDELLRVIDDVADMEDFLGDPNEPRFSGSLDLMLSKGDWTAFYGMTVVGSSGLTKQYDGDTFQFFGPYNGETLRQKLDTGTFTYHHLSVARQFRDGLRLNLGVRNVFDKNPPVVSIDWRFDGLRTGTAAQNSWDLLGRRFFLTLSKDFQ